MVNYMEELSVTEADNLKKTIAMTVSPPAASCRATSGVVVEALTATGSCCARAHICSTEKP